jgi:predicted  nucleic acid-binding Zn-ribbon protein
MIGGTSSIVSPDLQRLIRLQELDSQIESARRRVADIPGIQHALDERLAGQSAAVDAVKGRLAASQAARKAIENEVASIQTRLSKYKGQLLELKTNKEYQTMQHEIATAEAAIRSHEDRILEHMEEAETLTRDLKTAEAELTRQRGEIAAERTALEGEAAALRTAVDEKAAARGGLARELSPEALKLFEYVSRQRKGLAVAEARDGICTVCHVRLRPQVYNEVRRGENLIQCESCLRILYALQPGAATHAS